MFAYDKQGLGFAELTYLALNHSTLFVIVSFMVNHHMAKLALGLLRKIV